MTPEEAIEVARILSTADSGCPVCVRGMIEEAHNSFPLIDWATLVKGFNDGKAVSNYGKSEK